MFIFKISLNFSLNILDLRTKISTFRAKNKTCAIVKLRPIMDDRSEGTRLQDV